MINEATKGTSKVVREVSDLEVNNDAIRLDKKNDEEEPIRLLSNPKQRPIGYKFLHPKTNTHIETLESIQLKRKSTSSNQIPSRLEHECDPLESIITSGEANGEVNIEGRDFPDNSTYQANFLTISDQFDRKYIHARQMNEYQQLQN